MLCAARWALREGMHVVVDEVYASSEYYDVGPFVSALEWTPENGPAEKTGEGRGGEKGRSAVGRAT